MRAPDRRHSTEGGCAAPGGSASRDGSCFHPYRRQLSEGSGPAPGGPQLRSLYYGCFQEPRSPGASSATRLRPAAGESPFFWEPYNGLREDRFMVQGCPFRGPGLGATLEKRGLRLSRLEMNDQRHTQFRQNIHTYAGAPVCI